MNRLLVRVALLVLVLAWPTFPQGTGEVEVRVTLGGVPVDAKVLVRQGEKLIEIAYNSVREPGRVRMTLPAGTYTLVVDRGAGFHRPAHIVQIEVQSGARRVLEVALSQGFSPKAWGYYCADPHAHSNASEDGVTPPEELVAVLMAADLDLGFLTDHNNTHAHPVFAETAAGRGFPVVLGMEITAIRWHWNAFPLTNYTPDIPPMVMLGVAKPTPTFDHARKHGAKLIMANHPHSSYPYFDALGKPYFDPNFDLVEVMNGKFGEDDAKTLATLLQFWNEGKKYVAVATSDDHDWKEQTDIYGWPRTYVYVEGPLTPEAWLEALGKGRAFLTYGPLVNFTAQGGTARPGDTVAIAPGQTVTLEAELLLFPREAPRTLKSVQVIRNGQVLKEFTFTTETQASVQFVDKPERNSWYALRAFASDGEQAFTNPIWVEVR